VESPPRDDLQVLFPSSVVLSSTINMFSFGSRVLGLMLLDQIIGIAAKFACQSTLIKTLFGASLPKGSD
jgi:hypothetical protein